MARDYIVQYGFNDFHQTLFQWTDQKDFFEKLHLLPPNISEKIINDTEMILDKYKKKTTELVRKYSGVIQKLKDFIISPQHKYSFGYWISGEEATQFVAKEINGDTNKMGTDDVSDFNKNFGVYSLPFLSEKDGIDKTMARYKKEHPEVPDDQIWSVMLTDTVFLEKITNEYNMKGGNK